MIENKTEKTVCVLNIFFIEKRSQIKRKLNNRENYRIYGKISNELYVYMIYISIFQRRTEWITGLLELYSYQEKLEQILCYETNKSFFSDFYD